MFIHKIIQFYCPIIIDFHFCFFDAGNCGDLGTFVNGNITYDTSPINGRYPVSTIAYYSCDLYRMQYGGRLAFCMSSGSWKHQTGAYEPRRCLTYSGLKMKMFSHEELLKHKNKTMNGKAFSGS